MRAGLRARGPLHAAGLSRATRFRAWVTTPRFEYRLDGGSNLHAFPEHRSSHIEAVFSPDGRRVVSGGFDQPLRVWDTASGKVLKELEGHGGVVGALALSPDGKRVLSGGEGGHSDHDLRLADLESGKTIWRKALEDDSMSGYRAIAFSPDGKRALAAGARPRILDAATGEVVRSLAHDEILCAALSPDGSLVVSGGRDGALRLFDAGTGNELDRVDLATSADVPRSLAFARDGRSFLAGTARGVVLRFLIER